MNTSPDPPAANPPAIPPHPGAGPPQAGVPDSGIPASRRRLAWILAIACDVLQWVTLPFFLPGAAALNAVDVAMAVAMIALLGWHWAFLPTFVAELLPGIDLIPTWTMAVWIATRGRRR